MKQTIKRGLALLMALVLCVGLLPAIHAVAASNDVNYVTGSNGYIYNWGEREEKATFLSPNAKAFYSGNNTYDVLSSYAGGTGTSDAPKSALYNALQSLMKSKHKYETSYDATKNMYQYTDCENSGGKISSFYSGTAIGPAWGSSPSWNREHTWPNSKGLAGNDENDIMMLRPTASSENGARGNKAYGESSGYYNPNTESNGKHDLRGDVARIFLYVYVRWGNVNGNGSYTAWGSSGVMESLDVLLKWMEADPVDTWELGRNDSVESITGTRNVFVDYPEFAFLLFGKEIPNNMTTPSGEAGDVVTCNHNYVAGKVVAATCTAGGYTPYTCTLCGKSYQDNFTNKIAHNYVNGTCTVCGAAKASLPVNGDKVVIYAPAYNMALSAEKVATYYNKGLDVTNGFSGVTSNEIWVVTVNANGSYTFVSESGKVLALADEYASLNDAGTNDDWNITAKNGADGLFYIKNTARGNYLEWYASKNNWSTYATTELSDLFELSFYVVKGGTSCAHTNTKVEGASSATCTVNGHTGKTVCVTCGATVNAGQVITAPGHNYVNAKCTVCGASSTGSGNTSSNSVSVVVATYATANGWANSQQYKSMALNDFITATVSDGQNTGKYYDNGTNWRLYQTENAFVTITAEEGIVITSVKISYQSQNTGALMFNNAIVESDQVVTVNASSATFNVGNSGTAANGQARITAIEVTFSGGEAGNTCDHSNTKVEGAASATCTTAGHTGKTVCVTCGATVNSGNAIAATGHNYVNDKCSVCGASKPTTPTVTGETFYAVMNQASLGVKLYFTGAMDGYYLATTENAAEAAVLYKEVVDGGFKLYFLDGSVKNYINLTDRGDGKAGVELSTTNAAVFTMNEAANTPVATVAGNQFYLGTYGTYKTFSASAMSYITGENASKVDVSQFPLRLETVVVEDTDPTDPTDPSVDPTDPSAEATEPTDATEPTGTQPGASEPTEGTKPGATEPTTPNESDDGSALWIVIVIAVVVVAGAVVAVVVIKKRKQA